MLTNTVTPLIEITETVTDKLTNTVTMLIKTVTKLTESVTKRISKMSDENELFPQLKEESGVVQKRGFVPSVFISAALPLRDNKRNTFTRKYNNITMTLTGAQKVPYGKYGRLLLSILTTHAVQEKNSGSDEIILRYPSMKALLDEMQLPKQRTKDIMEQLDCFKQCTFVYEETKTTRIKYPSLFEDDESIKPFDDGKVIAEKVSTGLIPFFEAMQYVRITDATETQKGVAFEIKLATPFVKLSQKHSVPINYTVYKDISSPLGKDLYAWLCYRNNYIENDETLFIPRHSLVEQFMPVQNEKNPQIQEGNNYSYIKEQIEIIKEKYYPGLKVSFAKDGSGMELKKSPAAILPDDKVRYVLVTSDN